MSEQTAHVHQDKPVLYSTKETSEILGVTEKTLYLWRLRKQGPPYLRLMGKCRYLDIPRWIEANTVRH